MKTARYYLLRIKKRVSNTAQLPTKPDQVAEAGMKIKRLKGKPKSSLQSTQTKKKTK